MEHDVKDQATQVKEALADLKKKFDEQIEERTKAIADKAADDIKAAEDKIAELQEQAKELIKRCDEAELRAKDATIGEARAKSIGDQIRESLKKSETDLKTLHAKGGNLRIKAAELIDTGNFGAGVIQGYREAGINQPPRRRRLILGQPPIIPVMNGGPGSNPLTWIEWRPKEGGPAPTAESSAKPLLDWTYVQGTAVAKTIAVVAYVTKQALLNAPWLGAEINGELLGDLADELDYQALLGDNTGENLNGIKTQAKAFTGSGLAGEVQDAQEFDVIRAAILQVREGNRATTGYTRRTGYSPNYILVSPTTKAKMDVVKDTDGRYLRPFWAPTNELIAGVEVIESDFVPNDEFIVGDFSRALFNFVEGITLDLGFINDQFVKNQMTVRAEVYGMLRIKYHDTWAFVKGDFSTAKALIQATT